MDLPSGSPNCLCGDAEKFVCVHSTFDGEEKHALICGWKELKVRMQKTSIWGILADLIGRRLSFNITLFLAGVFGVAAGGYNNFTTLGGLIACVGFGIGGNLPVDAAIFLEFVPQSHQWLSTLLSAWWSLGQLFAPLIAWPLIGNFSSTSASDCAKSSNMGWRYTLGGVTLLMWVLRYFVFDLQESPKYLVGRGRDEEAIKVLEHIARIIMLWGLIGLPYPLFNGFITFYLTTQVADSDTSISTTYRDYTIISILGVPGSIIACLVMDWTRKDKSAFAMGGRKVTLAVSTALTGVFLFLFTTSKTEAAVLGFSCASGLTQNAICFLLLFLLYAYTPEVFPAPHRGTGDALCSSFNRIPGILAPVIKIATTTPTGAAKNGTANGPIFVSASLFIVSALLTLFLPIETMQTAGKAAL
ncbi:MFS general substrate transporter [Gymnopus androsaceus JB14]|uniref:MFS general substrate transporter n=1 Tax=Gymnopus androsaceus JB14 TaxID=1447944 RepID=A0A6A4GDT3_9AGAR|nr:MFS general substrate transporter [Gymnopus androsaceus JB14]